MTHLTDSVTQDVDVEETLQDIQETLLPVPKNRVKAAKKVTRHSAAKGRGHLFG